MTWQSASEVARVQVQIICARAAREGVALDALQVQLTDYASEAEFRALKGDDALGDGTLTFHRMAVKAAFRMLRTLGVQVRAVKIRGAELMEWLSIEGRANEPAERAAYIQHLARRSQQ